MIIERTPQQQQELQNILAKIREEYLEEIEDSHALDEGSGTRTELLMRIQNAMDDYNKKLEAAAFKELKGDKQAILDNAAQQIPLIIASAEDSYLGGHFDNDRNTFVEQGILSKKGDDYFLKASFMIWDIKDELELHFNALKKHKEESEIIDRMIIDAILKDPRIDTDDKDLLYFDPAQAERIKRDHERRVSLGKIKNFWFMSARTVNAITLSDPIDVMHTEPDGQLTMRWITDQASDKNKPVPTTITLTNTDNELKLKLSEKKIKPFDRAVMDTIGSAFKAWDYAHPGEPLHITPTALFRLLKGRQPGDKSCRVSENQKNRLDISIRKLKAFEFTIDIKAEVNANYLNEEGLALLKESGKLAGYYLTDNLVDVVTLGVWDDQGNRTPVEYVISRKPILHTYCEAKGQYLTVPFDVLDVFTEKNVTEHAIEIRNYLITQIENMKNNKGFRRSNKILLETLYKHAGMKDPQTRVELREEGDQNGEHKVIYASEKNKQTAIRKERAKDKEVIENMLKNWEKKGYIKGYTIDSQAIEINPGTKSK